MTATAATATTYYRTNYGSHRHQSWACANGRRAIQSGGVIEIPAGEVKDWAPCRFCCPEAAALPAPAPAAPVAPAKPQCPNEGVRNPRHIQSECRSCGKRGTVQRSTGKLRPHAPLNA